MSWLQITDPIWHDLMALCHTSQVSHSLTMMGSPWPLTQIEQAHTSMQAQYGIIFSLSHIPDLSLHHIPYGLGIFHVILSHTLASDQNSTLYDYMIQSLNVYNRVMQHGHCSVIKHFITLLGYVCASLL